MSNNDDNPRKEDDPSQSGDSAQEEKESFLGKILGWLLTPFAALWFIITERAKALSAVYRDPEYGAAAQAWSFLFCPLFAAEVGYDLGWLQHWAPVAWIPAAVLALPVGYYLVWPRLWKSLVVRSLQTRKQADARDENDKERWLNNILFAVSKIGALASGIAAGVSAYSHLALGGGPVQWFTQPVGVVAGLIAFGAVWAVMNHLVEKYKLHVIGVATAVALIQQFMQAPTAAFMAQFNLDQHLVWSLYTLEFFAFYGVIQPRLRMLVDRTFAFIPKLSKKVCDVMYEEKDEQVRKFFLHAANIGTSVHVGMASQGLWTQAQNPILAQYGLPALTGAICYLVLGKLFNDSESTRDSGNTSFSVLQSLHAAFNAFGFVGGVHGVMGTLISTAAAGLAGIAAFFLVIPGLYTLTRPMLVALSKLRVFLFAGPTFTEVMEKMWRKAAQFVDFVVKSHDLFMKDKSPFATIVAQTANISTTVGLYSMAAAMTGTGSWQSITTAVVAYIVGGKLFMRGKTGLANTIWSLQLAVAAGATVFAGGDGNQLWSWIVGVLSFGLSYSYVVPAAGQATKLAMLKVLGEKNVERLANVMEGVWRAVWNITKIVRTAFLSALRMVRAAFKAAMKAVRAAFNEVKKQWKLIQKRLAKIFGKNKDQGSK